MRGSWEAPATYCGFLDDMLAQAGGAPALQDLEIELTKSLLEGRLLAINDGYFFLNTAIQQALVREAGTPGSTVLGQLIRSGHLYILTRNGGRLDTLVEQMADEGLATYRALAEREDWKSVLKPAIEACFARAPSRAEPWPSYDLGEAFYAHLDHTAAGLGRAAPTADLTPTRIEEIAGRARDRFRAEGRRNARQVWFATVAEHAGDDPGAAGFLKTLGIETYHQSFASALAMEGGRVHVQTLSSGLYDPVYDLPRVAEPVKMITLRPPPRILSEPARFETLLAHDSPARAAQSRFLAKRRAYLERPRGGTYRDYYEAALEFEARVLEHFGFRSTGLSVSPPAAKRIVSLGLVGFGLLVGSVFGAPAAVGLGLAGATYWLEHFQLDRQRLRVSNAVAASAELDMVKAVRADRTAAFLDIPVRADAAADIMRDVTRFAA